MASVHDMAQIVTYTIPMLYASSKAINGTFLLYTRELGFTLSGITIGRGYVNEITIQVPDAVLGDQFAPKACAVYGAVYDSQQKHRGMPRSV